MRYLSAALAVLFLASPLLAQEADKAVKAAIEKGLKRIEQGATNYPKHRQCFSCHHQAMPLLGLTSAQQRGFAVDKVTIKQILDFSLKSHRNTEKIAQGQGIAGGNTQAVYILLTLQAGGHAADATTAALVKYLLARQRPDGSWPALAKRPPSEGSSFTNTALALHVLKAYGPAKDAKDSEEHSNQIDKAFAKGRNWLRRSKPVTMEDKVFHLRGLVYGGVEKKEIETARDRLLKEQKPDGSWSQLPELDGDAYATGSALLALRTAGFATSEKAYQKAATFLIQTQKDDGSWFVKTRSRPVQTFFDNGDPGGESQFISMSATSWAVLALLEQYPQGTKP
jgi:N-acyl-D-amino-acid deacylase